MEAYIFEGSEEEVPSGSEAAVKFTESFDEAFVAGGDYLEAVAGG